MDTTFAKPNAASELPTAVYCIEHERMESDLECSFPKGFTYSAPVNDLPDDWECQEPDDDQKAELELEEVGFWLDWLGGEE